MTRNSPRTKQNVLHRFTKRNMTGVVLTPYGLMGSFFFIWDDVFLFRKCFKKMALFYVII